MSDELKSAWELALEKLKASDEEPVSQLTREQKERIAELRNAHKARIAEREITLEGEIRKAAQRGEFDRIDSLRSQLVDEKRALEAERDEKIEEVRQGKSDPT